MSHEYIEYIYIYHELLKNFRSETNNFEPDLKCIIYWKTYLFINKWINKKRKIGKQSCIQNPSLSLQRLLFFFFFLRRGQDNRGKFL